MDTRKLSLVLMLGGAATTLLALIWFVAAYADAMAMASDFLGDDHAARMMACLYSSAPLCQGAGMLSDGPAYSPFVFWIGMIAVLAGIVVRLAAGKGAADGSASAETVQSPDAGEVMGFIPPGQCARYSYILALSGAVAGLLLTPLAIVAFAGFVLGLLGLTWFRPRLTALDVHHLRVLCLIFVAAALLLFITRGTFLFLLAALAQIACFYVGFNSYRHGRIIEVRNLKREFLMALQPGRPPATTQPDPTE